MYKKILSILIIMSLVLSVVPNFPMPVNAADGSQNSPWEVTVDTAALTEGWWKVDGEVFRGTITVTGNVNLILANGSHLTATGGANQAGISVTAGNSLTIHAESSDPAEMGQLTAQGGAESAGIGGGTTKLPC